MKLPELHNAAREIRESSGVRSAVVKDYGSTECIEVVASIIPHNVMRLINNNELRVGNSYGMDMSHEEKDERHMTLKLVNDE